MTGRMAVYVEDDFHMIIKVIKQSMVNSEHTKTSGNSDFFILFVLALEENIDAKLAPMCKTDMKKV